MDAYRKWKKYDWQFIKSIHDRNFKEESLKIVPLDLKNCQSY